MAETTSELNSSYESLPEEPQVYGMRVSSLNQEMLDHVADIYVNVVNRTADVDSIKRTLDAQSIAGKIKGNKYEALEFRLGSDENSRAKLWVSGKHTLVDDEEIVDFSYDPNLPDAKVDDPPSPLELKFKQEIKRYLIEKGLGVAIPEKLEEEQSVADRFKLRREYMATKKPS